VAMRSKLNVCSHLTAGTEGSNPAGGMDIRVLCLWFVVCCVGSGFCDRPITCAEESYRVCV
jgi:hypothetical protein